MSWIDHKAAYDSLAKLDYKLPPNVQYIRRSHKIYRENQENMESGIDSGKEKLCWSEDPEMYIWGRCAITNISYHNYYL